MVSTRSQKGQSTSNAANGKVSAPTKLATKSSKSNRHTPRKRVRVASSDAEAVEQPVDGDSPTEPGLRELLLSLPVELFGEICSFLDATELRCLSLADKTFWSVLVSDKSDPIWRQAFKRVVPPMPDCPEAMSSSDYAQLMLVKACTSGLKMKDWELTAAEWNTTEVKRVVKERKAFILSKLLDLGFGEADFPRYCYEVNLAKALDDEGWERIQPTVVSAAESSKISRLSTERWRRRNDRSRSLQVLWHEVVAIASGTRAVYAAEKSACSDFREFIRFAPVEALLEADTEDIPAQAIDSIRPDSLQFVIQGRRRYVVRLRNILDGLPPDHTNEEEWASLSHEETIAKLDVIAARLAKAVNGFWNPKQKRVDWYPSSHLSTPYVDLAVLSPVEELVPGLIIKMLESIDKDPDTESGAVAGSWWDRKMVGYRCARCDESVAPYLTFKEMISHFLEKKVWFDKASDAREKALAESPGSKDSHFHSILFNDHDWHSEGDIMVSDDSHEKARVRKLQNQLEAAYGNDPEDYNGEDFTTRSRRSAKQAPQRRTRRICRLCPEGFSPKPMYFATLKIHIEHTHCKAVNVEEDTAAFDPGWDVAPANPCIFEAPFARLYY
ncbi:hypothetical protein FS837_005797 [Tulasnella sp. UAMH 9824]|nr:hypothetical protein FS837_005797 [Tulasnella sp. UAMH 9824]